MWKKLPCDAPVLRWEVDKLAMMCELAPQNDTDGGAVTREKGRKQGSHIQNLRASSY